MAVLFVTKCLSLMIKSSGLLGDGSYRVTILLLKAITAATFIYIFAESVWIIKHSYILVIDL